MDYYIKIKEKDKEGAKDVSTNIVTEADHIFIKNIQQLITKLKNNTSFYTEEAVGSYEASRKRVFFFKTHNRRLRWLFAFLQ